MKKFILFLLIIFLYTNLSFSQNEEDSVQYETDEIMITGTRTEKKIIDIPYPVDRIDKSQFKFEKKNAIDNILGGIPGLFLESRYGNHDVRVSIRGFGSRSNSGIRGVRILLDGIPESEPDGQTRIEAIDFESVGRIEVVRGNSSSLYTNAPGGVINFINDVFFTTPFVQTFNEFGQYDLRNNGIKTGFINNDYQGLLTYKYHNYKGYRPHSEDYWHILNTVGRVTPGDRTSLDIYGYFVNGLIRLPGSLNLAQWNQDPFQANPQDVARDAYRRSNKGRVGLRFNWGLDRNYNNQIEVLGYGTIKYFERTAATFRIIDRHGVGGSLKYINRTMLGERENEIAVGFDIFYQGGPISEFNNINGKKGDILIGLNDETIANYGFYYSNDFQLIPDKLSVLLTGRYDRVTFDARDQILAVRNSKRVFDDFTPKFALNYKILPNVAFYTSYGFSFDSPAGNELDNYPTSSNPNELLNPDLQPQKTETFEIGTKGNIVNPNSKWLNNILYELTFFTYKIKNEIVPFDVFGNVYFRNSAQTTRNGIEAGFTLNIYRGLNYNFSYTFSDFNYDNYNAIVITEDSLGNLVTQQTDLSGNIVPAVPKHNINMRLRYEFPVVENVTAFSQFSYRHISSMYVNDQNAAQTNAYNVVNGLLGFDWRIGKFNMVVNAGLNNITNNTYVAFINMNAANNRFYEAGEPQNWFVGANFGYTLK
ncbi:MAG: TonB-dependent receptor [Ignavibacteria bacterium]|nr:TonB-dependent receptor [Ignavibacteria bacterium]